MCSTLPNTSTESNSGLAISEDAVPASSAAGSGYAEAKWLAEEMIMEVSRRTGMPATIVRLGQVCGDKLGHWNEKEWFSAMVKSSLITGTLPDHDIVRRLLYLALSFTDSSRLSRQLRLSQVIRPLERLPRCATP